MQIQTDFWNGRRVFVTGHTGFKGSWLTLWLQRLGAKVCGYSIDVPTEPSAFRAMGLERTVQTIFADICDAERLQQEMTKFSPDIIFHLAAQPLVRRSYREPVSTFAVNLMGTVNVLEAAKACSQLKGIVNITTDKCYENQEWDWGYRETDPLGGSDPYSASKACSEIATASYRRSFFKDRVVGIATARAGNIIGGGDWGEDRLIPDSIRAFSKNQSVPIRNPQSVRPWQHVIEPVGGYLRLAQAIVNDPSTYSCGWNFGPPATATASVGEIIDLFTTAWGESAKWHHEQLANQPHESKLLKLDSSRALALLGWHVRLERKMMVDMTARWYKEFYRGAEMSELSLAQIHAVETLEMSR